MYTVYLVNDIRYTMATNAEIGQCKAKICIIGSGLIGRSFAMLFAAAGYQVYLYDIKDEQVTNALADIKEQLSALDQSGLLRGSLSKEEQFQRISGCQNIESGVKNTKIILECVPEREELKKSVYAQVDPLMRNDSILMTSTSFMVPSILSKDLIHKNRFVVAHPTNPPFYAPLVEIVPAPWTDADAVEAVKSLCLEIGQCPVLVKKEIEGFVLNRMQCALLSECWRLVQNDVMRIEDIDKVMSEGIGRRYAFIGPLETAYLNADGWLSFAERYADMINRLTSGFGEAPEIEGPTLQQLQDDFSRRIPLDQLNERRKWRDTCLAALEKLKKNMPRCSFD